MHPSVEEVPVVTRYSVEFDCADPVALARFWAATLGYAGLPVDLPDGEDVMLEAPDGLPDIYFQRVPEGKVVKNRMHLDLAVGGDGPLDERRARIDAEAARLVALGASDRRGPVDEGGSYWMRMQDPEGNEFCLVSG
jgi:hypothetical protein